MTVVAGFDNPLSVLLTDDPPDMVRPHHHRSYSRRSWPAPTRPVARQIEGRPRIGAHEVPHFPAAPGGRTRPVTPPKAIALDWIFMAAKANSPFGVDRSPTKVPRLATRE